MASETLIITLDMVKSRLDKLLTEQYPAHSRTYFQSLIEEGFVLVNGLPIKKKDHPEVGDEVEICFQLTPEISLEPENIPLDILFEDDHLIAVNKPTGMVTHPAPGHPTGTFVHALLYHCKNLPASETMRPGIVHRLDKETSGILIAAKTSDAHRKLVEMFAGRKIEKIYIAVCVGSPGNITIEAPIKRHPTKRKEMAVDPTGKPATTICRVLSFDGKRSLVEVQPITGRTHQIRVHLKHRGTPVLGDPVYGTHKAPRLMLHAHRMKFEHPITGQLLELVAPLPSNFEKID